MIKEITIISEAFEIMRSITIDSLIDLRCHIMGNIIKARVYDYPMYDLFENYTDHDIIMLVSLENLEAPIWVAYNQLSREWETLEN